MPQSKIHLLDLNFLDIEEAIGSYLVETTAGPVLVESGPYSTFPVLEKNLQAHGYETEDLQAVLLTHIHFDHAGAAWAFAEKGVDIYLHPFGSKNMEDPSRLVESATRIYGDDMDRLWGKMKPISPEKLISMEDRQEIVFGDTSFIAHFTPGHARHHIAWQTGKLIFTGDVAGVKIGNGPVVPPCPPPDIDLESWYASIKLLADLQPEKLYLTHFGAVDDVHKHLDKLKQILDNWAFWMKERFETGQSAEEITPEFMEYTAGQLASMGVDRKGREQYEAANPSWMSVAGLLRYWKKRSEKE